MKFKRHHVKRLRRKAKGSTCKMRVSALGLNGRGEVVAVSNNKPRFSRYGAGHHAEHGVFHVAKQRGIETILICRIGLKGTFLPIDPCPTCAKIADKLGIRIYSIPADEI